MKDNSLSQKYKIIDINVDVLDRNMFISILKQTIEDKDKKVIFTPYSEFFYKAHIDEKFRDSLNSSDLNIADGVFVQIASLYNEQINKSSSQIINYLKLIFLIFKMILRKADRAIVFPELLSGSNEIKTICKLAESNFYSIYMLGSIQNVVYKAAQNLEKEFPNIKIVSKQTGLAFSKDDKIIIENIEQTKPNIVLVCFGAQKQEAWISEYKDKINANIIIGLGGTFDYVSGKRKLQSAWWSSRGLNWLHRLISEPIRWKRQIVIFKLLWILAEPK